MPTILEYLNEDCWRAVLQYVPVRNIIWSELVSRRWQRVVLVYLEKIRVGIQHPDSGSNVTPQDVSILYLREYNWSSFRKWIKKPGPMIVSAYCWSLKSFKTIGENCPYLKAVMFYNNIQEQLLRNHKYTQFKRLERVCFKFCYSDDENFAENTNLLVDYMPKLQYLEVSSRSRRSCDYVKFFESVCNLNQLEYLDVDYFVTDEELRALARSCPELRVLRLQYSTEITREGLRALSSGLRHLEELALRQGCTWEVLIEESAVVDFVRSCPRLKLLMVPGACFLSPSAVARAAAARREAGARGPLRLSLALANTDAENHPHFQEPHKELILEFSW